MTVTNTTSAIVPSTTAVTPGVYTLGGVTTVVETATTVVCPYAAVSTASGGVATSVIETTTYVCPAAGTYTIAPTTTTVTAPTEVVTVHEVETYAPGVYTAPAVTTVVTTATVVYCPFDIPAPTTSTTAAAPPATTESSSTSIEIPVVATTSSVTSVAASATPSSSGSTYTGTPNDLNPEGRNPWALTYTPYNANTGQCQTAEAVDVDVKAIADAGFYSLRVYSTDCDTLANVGAACDKYGLKMIVGIFIGSAGCDNASPAVSEQIASYKEWARWDLVDLFAVGNEAVHNGYCTATQLKDLINHVKSELPGYTGPYTTTDVVATWQLTDVQSEVCGVVDYVSANIHSYFDYSATPEEAGSFVQSQLSIVEEACGKEGFVLESGYPTGGNTIGNNVPSVANQKTAIDSITSTLGEKVVFFSMFDDQWKADGDCGCEKHWGMDSILSISITT